jgi:hypothetical protein
MPDSEWIVFLPLVGAVVGGIVGAWANSWYRDREAKKAQDRELRGLLALITSEVDFNRAVLKAIVGMISEDHTEEAAIRTISALRTETGDRYWTGWLSCCQTKTYSRWPTTTGV